MIDTPDSRCINRVQGGDEEVGETMSMKRQLSPLRASTEYEQSKKRGAETMKCLNCGRVSPACPETGYDADGFCSRECEEAYNEVESQSATQEANDAALSLPDREPRPNELCPECGGNGSIKIPGGVRVCPSCNGRCWASQPSGDRPSATAGEGKGK